ncbi:hypothetical protein N7468_005379 [Penicillium chermesinum]|uniref:Uncharacterized protein n=1 Tax=Penicillium chermesinum TaxID=63820 RepID=A0A9W9P1R0_9EURO|nr:uncharacterized protein N7468_005379 [Penicillium chermesinum]KAJ5232423.1 hypothetical protein N7468_005379 [Penicillium chermesinum]KAJ6172082.1 hypothetical protein N7470_001149 [Penicillium chermesinum]
MNVRVIGGDWRDLKVEKDATEAVEEGQRGRFGTHQRFSSICGIGTGVIALSLDFSKSSAAARSFVLGNLVLVFGATLYITHAIYVE